MLRSAVQPRRSIALFATAPTMSTSFTPKSAMGCSTATGGSVWRSLPIGSFQRTWLCAARIEPRAGVGPCPRWRRLLLRAQVSYATRRAGCSWSFEGAGFEASVALTYQPSSCAELKCQRGEKAVSQASFILRETESSNATRSTGESVANLTFRGDCHGRRSMRLTP